MSRTSSSWSSAPPHLSHFAGASMATMIRPQSPAVPGRDAVAPPELAGDAPVVDVVHPLEIGLGPVRRDELDRAVLDDADGLVGERLDADEPLPREVRLDDVLAAVAVADGVVVVLDLDEQALLA